LNTQLQNLNILNNSKLAIIGCGNIGQSILTGIIGNSHIDKENIIITKKNSDTLKQFKVLGVHTTENNKKALEFADIVIIALKPYNTLRILEEIKPSIVSERHILISVATGVLIQDIQSVVGTSVPIVRAMPNIATAVGESVTCICSNSKKEHVMQMAKTIFECIGTTVEIEEQLMEASTVLGACGIAYVLRFIRAMIQGGIQMGFDVTIANEIVKQTVKGAAELLIQNNQHPEFEIDKVTTPKGCTIVGLNEMEHNGFSSALIKGIMSSYNEIKK